jgi:hypothetical protein
MNACSEELAECRLESDPGLRVSVTLGKHKRQTGGHAFHHVLGRLRLPSRVGQRARNRFRKLSGLSV